MTQVEGRLFWLSAFALLLAAYFSDGHYHADEHHQILEFAASKLGTNEVANLAWEYEARMRPAVQPSMVVLLHQVLRPLGLEDPFRVVRILRVISALLSLWAMWLIYFAYRDRIVDRKAQDWFLLLSFFLWFLIYNNVRFSAENWSATLFIIGFAKFLMNRQKGVYSHFCWGLWMGAAFVFRFQTGFLILGFLAWLLFRERSGLLKITAYAAGGLLLVALGTLIDTLFYGEFVFAPYHYFEQNILLDKASGFGVEPWWYYLTATFELAAPPFSVVYILAVLIGTFLCRRYPLAWVLMPYILIHFLIGHKEVRFFFPLAVFIPILIIRSIEWVQASFDPLFLKRKWVMITSKLFWITNVLLLLVICFKPADHDVALWETVYDRYKEPTTIYYNHRSPYGFLLQHNYFKPKHVQIQKMPDVNGLKELEGTVVFYTREKELIKENGLKATLLFSTFPEWIRAFNFNGWLDRTKQDYLFEVPSDTVFES